MASFFGRYAKLFQINERPSYITRLDPKQFLDDSVKPAKLFHQPKKQSPVMDLALQSYRLNTELQSITMVQKPIYRPQDKNLSSPLLNQNRKKIQQNLQEMKHDLDAIENIGMRKSFSRPRQASSKIFLDPIQPKVQASPVQHKQKQPYIKPRANILAHLQPAQQPQQRHDKFRPNIRRKFQADSPSPVPSPSPSPTPVQQPSQHRQAAWGQRVEQDEEVASPGVKEEMHLMSRFRLKKSNNQQQSSIKQLMMLDQKSPKLKKQANVLPTQTDEKIRQRRLNFLEQRKKLGLPTRADETDFSLKGALIRRAQASKKLDRKARLKSLLESQ